MRNTAAYSAERSTRANFFLAHRINQLVEARRQNLDASLAVSFASVRWTIAYLTAAVARESELGAALFEDPGRWLPDKENEVLADLGELMDHVVTELNNYAKTQREAPLEDASLPVFDPKIAFKNQKDIRAMEHQILSLTQALARRIDDFLFTVEPA